MTEKSKPVLLSGIQPSGHLTIGNYLGAMRSWVKLQDRYDCLFVLVDLHAITVRQDPADLLKRCYDFVTLYLACGIDPARSTVFVQSHVPAHAQLAWVLNCFASVGQLSRMTQFKDKATGAKASVSAGLFDYPVLMAADILLYGTQLVPVGDDQKQHVELARDIAQRFNQRHGEVFTVPDAYMPKIGARVKGLQDPTAKMSKSDEDPSNYIALLDEPEAIGSKIRRAVTDSGTEVACDESRPGLTNLVTIYASISGESFDAIRDRYAGKGYGRFKKDLAELVSEHLRPIRESYKRLRPDTGALNTVLQRGAESARQRAQPMLDRVHRCLGFIPVRPQSAERSRRGAVNGTQAGGTAGPLREHS